MISYLIRLSNPERETGFGAFRSRYAQGRPPAGILPAGGSPTRHPCQTMLFTHRISNVRIPNFAPFESLSKKPSCRRGDSAPFAPDTLKVGPPLSILLLVVLTNFAPFESLSKKILCRRGDSNPYPLKADQVLNLARLPVPPLRHQFAI